MRMFSRLGTLAVLPLLAGCFDFTQDLSVAADGTATLVMESAMSAQALAMAGEGAAAPEDSCPAPAPEEVPAGYTATAVPSTREDGAAVCTMTVVGPLDGFQEILADPDFVPGGAGDQEADVTLTNEGNGEYTYAFAFEIPLDDDEPTTPELRAQQEQMRAMMLQMMADGVLTWKVTAPRIISTDGVLDGNTATFTMPLTAMITDQGQTKTFTVRFALR